MSLFAQNRREKTRETPWGLFWGGGKLCPGLLEGSLIFWGEKPCSQFDLSSPQNSPELVHESKIQNTGGGKSSRFFFNPCSCGLTALCG